MLFNSISLELFLKNKNITNQKASFTKKEFESTKILLSLKLNDRLSNVFKKEKLLIGDMFLIDNKLYIFHQILKKINKEEDVGLLEGFTFYFLENINNSFLPHLNEDVLYKKVNVGRHDSLFDSFTNEGKIPEIIELGNFYFDFDEIVEYLAKKHRKNKELINTNLLLYMGFFNTYKNKIEFYIDNERCNIRYYEKKDNFKKLHKNLLNNENYSFKIHVKDLNKTLLSSSFIKTSKDDLLFFGFNDYGRIDIFNESFLKGISFVDDKTKIPLFILSPEFDTITMFDKKEYYEEILEIISQY